MQGNNTIGTWVAVHGKDPPPGIQPWIQNLPAYRQSLDTFHRRPSSSVAAAKRGAPAAPPPPTELQPRAGPRNPGDADDDDDARTELRTLSTAPASACVLLQAPSDAPTTAGTGSLHAPQDHEAQSPTFRQPPRRGLAAEAPLCTVSSRGSRGAPADGAHAPVDAPPPGAPVEIAAAAAEGSPRMFGSVPLGRIIKARSQPQLAPPRGDSPGPRSSESATVSGTSSDVFSMRMPPQ